MKSIEWIGEGLAFFDDNWIGYRIAAFADFNRGGGRAGHEIFDAGGFARRADLVGLVDFFGRVIHRKIFDDDIAAGGHRRDEAAVADALVIERILWAHLVSFVVVIFCFTVNLIFKRTMPNVGGERYPCKT